jgi:hypothetical protein
MRPSRSASPRHRQSDGGTISSQHCVWPVLYTFNISCVAFRFRTTSRKRSNWICGRSRSQLQQYFFATRSGSQRLRRNRAKHLRRSQLPRDKIATRTRSGAGAAQSAGQSRVHFHARLRRVTGPAACAELFSKSRRQGRCASGAQFSLTRLIPWSALRSHAPEIRKANRTTVPMAAM